MTLNEITSAIRNRVADGLSGNISNQAFSLEQLEEEVDLQRSEFINKYAASGNKLNANYLYQSIDGIHVTCQSLSQNAPCGFSSGDGVPAIKLPAIAATFDDSAIEYIGLMNKQEDFIVYHDTDSMQNHKYRIRTAHLPFVWVDTTPDANGYMTAFLMNAGKYFNLKYMSVRAIFEHPSRLGTNAADYADKEYPAPGHMQNQIIDALTEKYVRYFRQLNIPSLPNTQSDPIT